MTAEAALAATPEVASRLPLSPAARSVALAYLFVFAAAASLIPFISIYYRSLGLGAGTIGWLVGLPLVVGVVAAPLWTGFADARHRHRTVLSLTICGAAAAASLAATTDRVLLLLAIVVVHAALYAPVNSLIDNGALVALGGRSGDYGRLRVWGTVGWGVSAPVVGWAVSAYGPRWIFAIYVGLMLLCLTCAVRIPMRERPATAPFRTRVDVLRRDARFWVFLLVTLLGGIGMSMVNAYLPLDLDGMGARGLVGVALVVATLSELPVMLLGGRMLASVGVGHVFVLGYFVYGLRAVGMALVQTPWGVVALQATHGLSFALVWIAGTVLARRLAPVGLGATAQGMFTSTSIGLGGALGSVLGGALFSASGPAATFAAAAVVLCGIVPAVALAARRRAPFAR